MRKNLKNEQGQVLIEFALSMFVIFAAIYCLIILGLWGLGSIYTQDAAVEAAQAYATMLDKGIATDHALEVMKNGGYIFVKTSTLTVNTWVSGTDAYAEVSVEPKIQSMFFLKTDRLHGQSKCTLEDVFRNPDKYNTRS